MSTPPLVVESATFQRADKAPTPADAACDAGLAVMHVLNRALSLIGMHARVYYEPIAGDRCRLRAELATDPD